VLSLSNAPPFTSEFILGGDKYGRDILSRLIASSTGALVAAAILCSVATVIGVTAGLIAGYFGRVIDALSVWVFSAIMVVPAVIILISLYTLLGATMQIAMIVFGVLVSPSIFWVVRTLTRGVRNEAYVDAARVAGLSNTRIVGRHVLLAIRAPVILLVAGLAGAGIGVQAGLEFLGLGDPSLPSWGSMLTDAFNNIYVAPTQLIWPAVALGLVTGSFTLISIGLRDALEGTAVGARRRSAVSRSSIQAGAAHRDPSAILEIENLSVGYRTGDTENLVVRGVSLQVRAGETVGVVGESGSGKTQTVFATLGVLPSDAIVVSGSIRFDNHDILSQSERQLEEIRGRDIGYVPQEPLANLDPSFTVGTQMIYTIRATSNRSRAQAKALALELFARVGIRDPERVFRSYPHQISGGMAQRVLIAGAICNSPRLLLADEPTTALDVTIQAEVLDLLRDLQSESGMAILIVTHNFGVIADLCDRVVVMRRGEVVEQGVVTDVFRAPQHEYTRLLLDSVIDDAAPPAAWEATRA
jgi:peptide/nickel transport system permease protein